MTDSWLQAEWPAPSFIQAGTTLRQGGVSTGEYSSLNIATHVGDELTSVEKNRLRLNLPNEPQWLEQVHSTKVILLPHEEFIPKADAAYTEKENIICSVMTADCLPLLITNKQGSCVAAIHAGWRGLCNGIIEATIQSLPAEPESLLVWLGPAIGPDVYEVGEEVYEAYTKANNEAKQAFTSVSEKHWLFDIYKVAKLRLHSSGVKQVFGGDRCTFTEKDKFFSYRRDNVTGRMASMIWIEPDKR